MFIAANDQITIEHFGKAGEHAAFQDDRVHLWGNCIDGGLKIIFRQSEQQINKFSASARGEVRFNSEWGRFRFEGYDRDGHLTFIEEFSPQDFPIDPDNFRPFVIDLSSEQPVLKKVQLMFLGPAMIDLEFCDIIIN